MDWQFDDERPIYAQLMEQVERAVVCGAYKPGERLPGVREMAFAAGVNPNTMQRALAELENRGLLQSQRTSGRFVTEDGGMIAALRQSLARTETQKYCEAMAAIGCTKEQMLQAVAGWNTEVE